MHSSPLVPETPVTRAVERSSERRKRALSEHTWEAGTRVEQGATAATVCAEGEAGRRAWEALATALPAWHGGSGRTRKWESVFSRPANTYSPDFCKHGKRAKVSASGKMEQFARRLLCSGTKRPRHDSRLLAGDLAAKPTSWPAPPARQSLGGGRGLSSWRAHRTCLPSETSAGTSGSC